MAGEVGSLPGPTMVAQDGMEGELKASSCVHVNKIMSEEGVVGAVEPRRVPAADARPKPACEPAAGEWVAHP